MNPRPVTATGAVRAAATALSAAGIDSARAEAELICAHVLGVPRAGLVAADGPDDAAVLRQWLALEQRQSELKQQIKEADATLDRLAYNHYARLSVDEIKTLVVEDKWLAALTAAVQGELERVSQTLTGRIRQLAERYAAPLPQIVAEVDELSARVEAHLAKMGATWQ